MTIKYFNEAELLDHWDVEDVKDYGLEAGYAPVDADGAPRCMPLQCEADAEMAEDLLDLASQGEVPRAMLATWSDRADAMG